MLAVTRASATICRHRNAGRVVANSSRHRAVVLLRVQPAVLADRVLQAAGRTSAAARPSACRTSGRSAAARIWSFSRIAPSSSLSRALGVLGRHLFQVLGVREWLAHEARACRPAGSSRGCGPRPSPRASGRPPAAAGCTRGRCSARRSSRRRRARPASRRASAGPSGSCRSQSSTCRSTSWLAASEIASPIVLRREPFGQGHRDRLAGLLLRRAEDRLAQLLDPGVVGLALAGLGLGQLVLLQQGRDDLPLGGQLFRSGPSCSRTAWRPAGPTAAAA